MTMTALKPVKFVWRHKLECLQQFHRSKSRNPATLEVRISWQGNKSSNSAMRQGHHHRARGIRDRKALCELAWAIIPSSPR
jgi:hypothetical protein